MKPDDPRGKNHHGGANVPRHQRLRGKKMVRRFRSNGGYRDFLRVGGEGAALLSDGRGGDRRPDELTPMFLGGGVRTSRRDSLDRRGLCPALVYWLIANGTRYAPEHFECDEECWCRVHRPRLVAIRDIVESHAAL